MCNRVKSVYQSRKLRLVQLLQTRKDVDKNTKEALKMVFYESQENRVHSRKQSNSDFWNLVGKHRSHLRNYFFVNQEVQTLDCRRIDENMFSDSVSYVQGFSRAVNPRNTTVDNVR